MAVRGTKTCVVGKGRNMSLIQTGIDCLTGTNGLTVYGPPPSSGTNGLHVDASAFAPALADRP